MRNSEILYSFLLENFPDFKEYWESEENCNKNDDGTYTLAGLCAEFSQYFIDYFQTLTNNDKKILFTYIEDLIVKSLNDNNYSEMSESLKGCFLENISRTEAGELSKKFMGEKSLNFFEKWHVYP